MERRRRRPRRQLEEKSEKNKESPKDIFKAKLERICEFIEEKFTSALDAAILAGLTEDEFKNHMEKGSLTGFEARIIRAESTRDLELLTRTLKGDQNAKWALERLSPEKFSRPSVTERIKEPEEDNRGNRPREDYEDDDYEDYDPEIDGLGEFDLSDEDEED